MQQWKSVASSALLPCVFNTFLILRIIVLHMPIVFFEFIIYLNLRLLVEIEGHFKMPSHQGWRIMQGSLNVRAR